MIQPLVIVLMMFSTTMAFADGKSGYLFIMDGSESMLEKSSNSTPSKAESAVLALNSAISNLKEDSRYSKDDIYAGTFYFITQARQKDGSRPTTLEPSAMPLRKLNQYSSLPVSLPTAESHGYPVDIDTQIRTYFRGQNTGIGDAILLAQQKIAEFPTKGISWNIILLTDGKQNAGHDPESALRKIAKESSNIRVHCISYETSDELSRKLYEKDSYKVLSLCLSTPFSQK